MNSNQPWKSKVLMTKLCATIGATLDPVRRTDPKGKRVFVVRYEDKLMGFYTMKELHSWLLRKLNIRRR
jgi:hypothetical protein